MPRFFLGCLVLCLTHALCGCQTARFYKQAVAGQMEILRRPEPIKKLLGQPATPERLRESLTRVLEIRQFAETELQLKANGHYLAYADLRRPFVVWNVHAAPEFSLEPKSWWYPVVGRLKYQGYFSEAGARNYAAKLRAKGYDVYVGGVEAYSTLGWFRDPVLNTFVFRSEPDLADLLFHELAHQRVFAKGDTDFNEAFATAVAEEGLRRWLLAKGDTESIQRAKVEARRQARFVALLADACDRLRGCYSQMNPEQRRSAQRGSPAELHRLREEKERILTELRRDYERLKTDGGGDGGYDHWFDHSLNNAKLNTVETYYKLVPAFRELLRRQGGDLPRFYREAERLTRRNKTERNQRLQDLLAAAQQPVLEFGNNLPCLNTSSR